MKKEKREALEAAGWVFTNAEDFLELTQAERDMVELRLSVSRSVRGAAQAGGPDPEAGGPLVIVKSMARPLRIAYPHAYYHVTCRGNDRRAIFRDDRDRTLF